MEALNLVLLFIYLFRMPIETAIIVTNETQMFSMISNKAQTRI